MIRHIVFVVALLVAATPAQAQKKYADPEVDEAIRQGLKYLASTQNQDGSWYYALDGELIQ